MFGSALVAMQNLARFDLRVCERFRHAPHAQCGHVVRLEIIFPLLRGFFDQYLLQLGCFRLEILTAVFVIFVKAPAERS